MQEFNIEITHNLKKWYVIDYNYFEIKYQNIKDLCIVVGLW